MQQKLKIRKIFDPSEDEGIAFTEVDQKTGEIKQAIGRTVQAFRDECDINKIMEKYAKTGALPDLIKTDPQYGDFSGALAYKEALELILFAQEQFMALDAHVRERFLNDPEKFLAFATDGNNVEEMVKMGLATAREAPESKSKGSGVPQGTPEPKKPKGGKAPVGDPPSGEGPDA